MNHWTAAIEDTRGEERRNHFSLTSKIKTIRSGLDPSLLVRRTSITVVHTYYSSNPGTFWSAFRLHNQTRKNETKPDQAWEPVRHWNWLNLLLLLHC